MMATIVRVVYLIPMGNGTGYISEIGKEQEDMQDMGNGSDSEAVGCNMRSVVR